MAVIEGADVSTTPIVEKALSEPQIKQYRDIKLETDAELRDKAQQRGHAWKPPPWRESVLAAIYNLDTNNPNAYEIGALAFFAEDQGMADLRQFESDLDMAYRRPDGSIDQQLLERDRFVIKMERAFMKNKGNIPPSWFVDNAQDIDMLEGLEAETIEKMYNVGEVEALIIAREQVEKETFDRSREPIGLIPGVTPASIAASVDEIGEITEYDQGVVDAFWDAEVRGARWLWGGLGHLTEKWRTTDAGKATINLAGDTAGAILEGNVKVYAPSADTITARRQRRDAALTKARDDLGMTQRDFVLQAGFGDALDFARNLPQINPEQYEMFVQMAGGDSTLAQAMIVDTVLNEEENQKHMEKQRVLYNHELDLQITEMENNDFNAVDTSLDFLGAYGNVVQTIGVGATLAAVSIIGDQDYMFWDDQYMQDLKNYDTPAHVLGIEGTLVGLLFNFTVEMFVDPGNFLFSPLLKSGVQSIDDVARALARKATTRKLEDVMTTVNSMTHNGIASETMSSVFTSTGLQDELFAIMNGFDNPLIGIRSLEKANVSTDVLTSALDDITRAGDDVTQEMIDTAAKRIQADGIKPIEISLNPSTGKVSITRGADELAYYTQEGVSNVPATVKLDISHGTAPNRKLLNYSDESADIIHNIANGTTAATIRKTSGYVKRNPKVQKNMIDRAETLKNFDADDIAMLPDGAKSIEEVGTVHHDKLGELKVVRTKQADDLYDYSIYRGDGEAVGNLAVNGNEVTSGLRHDARGVMNQVYDLAHNQGDDVILLHGLSESTSEDALLFAEKYAKGIVDDPQHLSVNTSSIDDMSVVEWGKGFSMDNEVINVLDDGLFVAPNRIMPDDIVHGKGKMEQLKGLYKQHLLMGGEPINANRTALATKAGQMVGDFFRSSPKEFAQWIDNFITPINANAHFDFTGAFGRTQVNQFGARLYSSVRDMKGWEPFQRQIQAFYRKQGILKHESDALTAQLAQLHEAQGAILTSAGGKLDDGASAIGTKLSPEDAAAHRAMTDISVATKTNADAILAKQQIIQDQIANYDDLNQIMDDMMTDFNRRHIATREDYKPLVNDDGIVPWDEIAQRTESNISRDSRIIARAKEEGISLEDAALAEGSIVPDSINEMIGVVGNSGKTLDEFVSDAHNLLQHKSSWKAPASPLEIMAAANGGQKAVQTTIARLSNQQVAEGIHAAHTFWVLDKVLTPRTGITVALDELISGFHAGGTSSVFRYAEDKAIHLADHIASVRGTEAWHKLPDRWKERLSQLEEYPTYLRQQERSFLEMSGVGFDEIKFKPGMKNNASYYEAAQRTAQGYLSDPGFAAYLEGPQALDRWLSLDTTAARMRSMEFYDVATKKTRTGATTADVRAGYESIEKWMTNNLKSKDKARAMAEYRKAAIRAQEKGSTAAGSTQLPDWVLEGWGTVTGNVDVADNILAKGVEKMSNAVFQKPLNYRRGWNSTMIRSFEEARLQKLYKSQGKVIVSEAELRAVLRQNYPGYSDDVLTAGIGKLSSDLARDYGIISRRYVDELIEQKVIHEIEGRMYSFTMESRAGRKVKGVAPFGKPYGDMVGRWTRELASRPQLRGWVNNTNFLNMSNIANKAVDTLPFNPKTAGFLSRVANTEFDLDRIQEDPIVGRAAQAIGLEKIDLSAGLFLPHEGDNPLNVLLPGLGIVPVGALTQMFNLGAPDPVEDPLAYQDYTDDWAQWVPSMGFNKPQGFAQQMIHLFVGGGTSSKLSAGMEAAVAAWTGEARGASALQQSWAPRVAADRQVKVVMSSGEFLEELTDLPDDLMDEGISVWLDEKMNELTEEGVKAQGAAMMKQIGTNLMVPVRPTYDSVNDNLNEVWIESVGMMELEVPEYMTRSGTSTPDEKRRVADWARNQFFDLEDWERDALVSDNEGLAVNLVSMWQWTDAGKNASMPENNSPYRTGGSTTDAARHQTYLDMGWIQPLGPKQLAVNILGTMLTAKDRTAKAAYTEAAASINKSRWESFDEAQQDYFQEMADYLREEGELPYKTGKALWNNYADMKRAYDTLNPPDPDDPDDTGYSVPTEFRAWGEEMPSNPEELRKDFGPEGWTIGEPSEKLKTLVEALGLDLDGADGISMSEVYVATADARARTRLDNPIFAHIDAAYRSWLNPRNAGQQAFTNHFGAILDGKEFNTETRAEYKKNQVWIGEALDLRAEGDPSWRAARDTAVDQFSRMIQDDAFRGTDGAKLWDDAYGRTLGSLDWKPDTAPFLIDEEGNANPDASQIYVRDVLDGDTLDVSFGVGLGGGADTYRIRLLGWNAQELGQGGEGERDDLTTAIQDAIEVGMPIAIVRDPERYGNVDMYGRMFGWLYIGNEVWYNADTMIPRKN